MSVANPKGEAQDVPNNPSLSATNKNPSSVLPGFFYGHALTSEGFEPEKRIDKIVRNDFA